MLGSLNLLTINRKYKEQPIMKILRPKWHLVMCESSPPTHLKKGESLLSILSISSVILHII